MPPDRPLDLACEVPALAIPRPSACERSGAYPWCKWRLPDDPVSRRYYRRWRNTLQEHSWGRPALVSLVLATAAEYQALHPDQPLRIGDLDAPGPRHESHSHGVDVDLYLPGAMMTDSLGARQYVPTYRTLDAMRIAALRQRVYDLARVLATCADGDIRIFYNDPIVRERFLSWYRGQGYHSSFGAPMQEHNELHEFHFHVTVRSSMSPLPLADDAPPGPLEAIQKPPAIQGVTVPIGTAGAERPVWVDGMLSAQGGEPSHVP